MKKVINGGIESEKHQQREEKKDRWREAMNQRDQWKNQPRKSRENQRRGRRLFMLFYLKKGVTISNVVHLLGRQNRG